MVLVAGHGSADAPPCDVTIVCGGPAGERRSRIPRCSPARGPRSARRRGRSIGALLKADGRSRINGPVSRSSVSQKASRLCGRRYSRC